MPVQLTRSVECTGTDLVADVVDDAGYSLCPDCSQMVLVWHEGTGIRYGTLMKHYIVWTDTLDVVKSAGTATVERVESTIPPHAITMLNTHPT